jgi:hypothetical protein
MLSILQIDGIAKRYGVLPSEILKNADTFDLYVMDAAMTFEKFHHDKEMNKGKVDPSYYSQDQLESMLNKGKNYGV